MTERELIARQQQLGDSSFMVSRCGSFFVAYGAAAFALARATGYRVMRRVRKGGVSVLSLGFPESRVEHVKNRITAAGGMVDSSADDHFLFSGIDGSEDMSLVFTPTQRVKSAKRSPIEEVYDGVMSFDISRSTPLDAMIRLAHLQEIGRADKIIN
jgi:hypothetical protein